MKWLAYSETINEQMANQQVTSDFHIKEKS